MDDIDSMWTDGWGIVHMTLFDTKKYYFRHIVLKL